MSSEHAQQKSSCTRRPNMKLFASTLIVGCFLSIQETCGTVIFSSPATGIWSGRIEGALEGESVKGVGTVLNEDFSVIPLPKGFILNPNGIREPYEIFAISRPGAPKASGGAINISRGGNYVVGSIDNGFFTPFHAFLWSADGGLLDLGTLDPTNNESFSSSARDVANNGLVVVGGSQFSVDNFGRHAFRWTKATGMIDLGSGNGPSGHSEAFGVSANGSIIVGKSEFPPLDQFSLAPTTAFRWTEADGFQSLGTLIGPSQGRSIATAVTADGSVIIGDSRVAGGGQHAFRWTQQDGMTDLGTLSGDRYAAAMGVSDDGSIIVGLSSPEIIDRSGRDRGVRFNQVNSRAFYWTEETGMQDLTQLLVDAGNTSGIQIVAATGISPDGTLIGGITTVPDPEFPDLFVNEVPLIGSLTFTPASQPALRAGDADQDLDFDQFDLIRVLRGGKYRTGQPATRGDGDWDGAPGGSVGNPPAGNGIFDQFDVIAAQRDALYLHGPYAAVQPDGQLGDAQTSVVYDATTGELRVDAPAGTELTSINIDSASGIFTGRAAENLGGSFDNDSDTNIFKATFGGSFGSISLGNVAQTGLAEDLLLNDLTVVGSLQGGGDLGEVDLVYVPEPTAMVLLALALGALGSWYNDIARHSRGRTRKCSS